MKPSQTAMLADLSKCYISSYADLFLVQGLAAFEDVRLNKHYSTWLRRLWHKYQPQIMHNKKHERNSGR